MTDAALADCQTDNPGTFGGFFQFIALNALHEALWSLDF